jgi:hypothetical protein
MAAAAGLSTGRGEKFRFRAGLAAWQSRNALPISVPSARECAANHGIVTVIGGIAD